MAAGIYEIRNVANGNRYVGSASDLDGRFAVHRHFLSHRKHHSRYLQRAFDRHGAAGFVFRPLLLCAKRDLLFYEQRAIDGLKPEYNLCPIAANTLGLRWTAEARIRHSVLQRAKPTFIGRKHTPETLKKMSLAKLGNTGGKGKPRSASAIAASAAWHRGKKRSPETRARIAAKARGRTWSEESKAKLSATLRARRPS
jgi:group I intron endonuclease